ncbi:hypothetical protein FE257_008602 [Aspergillus nanangensis]|uniref:chitinase n=1 Tax=Aspergillus nanangensis TaxID=2582783 RepID=A0AAD4CL24_ASPNN|nr:hypothetical protein FE257_008602 [Aspergillus nanangensis]
MQFWGIFWVLFAWLIVSVHTQHTGESNITRNQTRYSARFTPPSNSTAKFRNFAALNNVQTLGRTAWNPNAALLRSEQEEGTCGPGMPCVNGACCNSEGLCGYCDEFCGADTCISNCDAKAQCGECGVAGQNTCPLNVCCSEFGFCGATSEFCDDGCKEGYGGCGEAPRPSCVGGASTSGRRIAYYESWAIERDCDATTPEDLDLAGITHLNFAFAFFHPTTFEITPMAQSAEGLYSRLVAQKNRRGGLQVWVAVGGWSFNDETNVPNTRTAFSDMAGSRENRQKFIASLLQFMRSYGFDGVDLDWEYPGADDRGGKSADTANYVTLLREMREAFGSRYGISAAIPASFWYLRWFDVNGMQSHLDWFNIMTYDIHGVWDADSKFTGPYVRPHTNLTDIDKGLDLLWRAGVEPSKVNLGLAWYGRSFTLEDPDCAEPGCIFKEGGAPGKCTDSSGTLSNSEIFDIIDKHSIFQTYDACKKVVPKAGVNWITGGGDQWVSYDDEVTLAQKVNFANSRCLGGTMIWAIDMDNANGTSNKNTIGLGKMEIKPAVFLELSAEIYTEDSIEKVATEAKIADACYTSFCGDECASGYTSFAKMRGQVDGIKFNTTCEDPDKFQTLCCVTGGFPGRCEWRGWRGQGLRSVYSYSECCSGGCRSETDPILAVNTNHYLEMKELNMVEDQTCNGGYQKFCCRGFNPPDSVPSKGLALIHPESEVETYSNLNKRDGLAAAAKCASTSAIVVAGGALLGVVTGGLGAIVVGGLSYAVCLGTASTQTAAAVKGGYSMVLRPKTGGGVQKPPKNKPKGSGSKGKYNAQGQRMWGRHAEITYATSVKTCSVTYTCSYGLGWDEVCDNQRWGIDKILGGNTVYHKFLAGRGNQRRQVRWGRDSNHHPGFREWPQPGVYGNRNYCEGDEFPMGSLDEAQNYQPQAVRQIDGDVNGLQGADFQSWLAATWMPCSNLLQSPPPITWAFDGPHPGDNRLVANGVIGQYGFNSMLPNHRCFPKYRDSNAAIETISDHGFRVDLQDPLFDAPINWPSQDYGRNPANIAANAMPTSVNSANYLKKRADEITATCAEPVPSYPSIEDYMWMYQVYASSPPPPEPTHLLVDEKNGDHQPIGSTPRAVARKSLTYPTPRPSVAGEQGS